MATLILLCGLAGAGKTSFAKELERTHDAIRLSPDEWIKEVIHDESDKFELGRLRRPIETLQWQTARRLLARDATVVLENGFWSKEERNRFSQEARALGARVELHYFDVPKEELWRRIEGRNAAPPEGSFRVSREELDFWWTLFIPPDDEETVNYDSFHRFQAGPALCLAGAG